MIGIFKKTAFAALFSLLSFNAFSAPTKVTLMVLYDLSDSMEDHYPKMAALAPLVREAMENSRCEFKVSVGNIHYNDEGVLNDYHPFGSPGFVTSEMGVDKAVDLISYRLQYPHLISKNYVKADGSVGFPIGSEEETYSSIVRTVRTNIAQLSDQDVVGTLMLTDAAPGFETLTPSEALNQIKGLLGSNTMYIPGMISYPYENGMNDIHPAQACKPDWPPGTAHPPFGASNLRMGTSAWMSSDLDAINNFVKQAYGYQWDICDQSYDESLREYLQTVLVASGCLLLM